MSSKVKLPAEVAQKYRLVGWTGGAKQVFGKWGTVDLSTLTLEKADRLFQRKFPKLELNSAAAKELAKTNDTAKKA